MALGADVSSLRLRASRKVAFRSLSLLLIGGYLLRHYFMYSGVYAYPW